MRKSLSLTVAFGVAVALLTAPSAGAATKISNGTACTKLGASTTVAGYAYKCAATVKSNLKIAGEKSIVLVPVKNLAVKNAKKTWISTSCISTDKKALTAKMELTTIKKSSDEKLAEYGKKISELNTLLESAATNTPLFKATILEDTSALNETIKKLADAASTSVTVSTPNPINAEAIKYWENRIQTINVAIAAHQKVAKSATELSAKDPTNTKAKESLAKATNSIAKLTVDLEDAKNKLDDLKQVQANATSSVKDLESARRVYETRIDQLTRLLKTYDTAKITLAAFQQLSKKITDDYNLTVTTVNDLFDQRNIFCSEGL